VIILNIHILYAPFRLSTLSLKGKDSGYKLRFLIQSLFFISPLLGEIPAGRGVSNIEKYFYLKLLRKLYFHMDTKVARLTAG